MNETTPIRITVTGAAGAIGYALLFRIAAGDMLGPNQPVELRLLEIPPALPAAEGVAMELTDSAFGLLRGIDITADANRAFDGTNYAILVGAMPRKQGMDRADLLAANADIFTVQGRAIGEHAAQDARVLVVGNPANTNAAIARAAAPDVPGERFHALMRLDHNRAVAQLAARASTPDAPVSADEVGGVVVWGNHSNTQVPDIDHATISGVPARERIADDTWLDGEFSTTVAGRGAAIIAARGASSAASAASAVIDHVRDWHLGSRGRVTIARPSQGEYGVPDGLVFGMPAVSDGSAWTITEGLEHRDRIAAAIAATTRDLETERDAVRARGIAI